MQNTQSATLAPALDRAALLARLNLGMTVDTSKARAYRANVCRIITFHVDVKRADGGAGSGYRFDSAALAVAFLASL